MNTFDDYIAKYFDMIYSIPQFSEKKLLELVNKIISNALEKESFSAERRLKIDNQVREENSPILNNLKERLNTIRKVKIFERVLSSKINQYRADIYFPDILIISLVEASDSNLYNYIRSNFEKFSISPYTQFGFNLWTDSEIKYYQERIKELLAPIGKSDLIDFLFPHLNYVLNFKLEAHNRENIFSDFIAGYNDIYEKVEKNNRLALDLLLFRLFTGSSVDKSIELITSQDYKDEIIKSLSQQKLDINKSRELLFKIFPAGDDNYYLRKISLGWVYDQIKSQNLQISRNFVLALSFIAKNLSNRSIGLFGLEEKKQASYQVWHYLERKESNMQILTDILSFTDNSDEFADNVLFYSINPDRTPRNIKVPIDTQNEVVIKYLIRLFVKLKWADSIYNLEYFDAPLSTIWRWYNALEFIGKAKLKIDLKFNLKDHILKILKSDIKFFEAFFDSYVIQDYEEKPAAFRPEELYRLIGKEDLRDLISQYMAGDKFNQLPLRFYQSMTDWLKTSQ